MLLVLGLDRLSYRLQFLGKRPVVRGDLFRLRLGALGFIDQQHRQNILRKIDASNGKIKPALFVVVDDFQQQFIFALRQVDTHFLLPGLGLALGFL